MMTFVDDHDLTLLCAVNDVWQGRRRVRVRRKCRRRSRGRVSGSSSPVRVSQCQTVISDEGFYLRPIDSIPTSIPIGVRRLDALLLYGTKLFKRLPDVVFIVGRRQQAQRIGSANIVVTGRRGRGREDKGKNTKHVELHPPARSQEMPRSLERQVGCLSAVHGRVRTVRHSLRPQPGPGRRARTRPCLPAPTGPASRRRSPEAARYETTHRPREETPSPPRHGS